MKQIAWLVSIAAVLLGGMVVMMVLHSRAALAPSAVVAEVTPEYGQHLIRNTALELGSGQPDPQRRFTGNNLACASCHLDSGQMPGTLSLMQAASKYPRFSGRDGVEADLTDRINGCMQRSMNGRPLERDSVAMRAMVSYIEQLGRWYEASGASRRTASEPAAFAEPARKADMDSGAAVYRNRCQVCHGQNGEGLKATGDLANGYLFPALWGPDSYNIGAGMARVLTAARFIKARMPLGQPTLTDDEAFDVAAYINSHDRPDMANLEKDYPDLKSKPVDSPYPPYADPFSREQHRVGPFAPIREFYRKAE
jgi:thiosulfate dehydrogenase